MPQGPLYSIDGDGEQILAGVLQGGWSDNFTCGGAGGVSTWVEIFLNLDWIKTTIESEGGWN